MTTIETFACARAGLLGNPSDGYHGKTLGCTVGQYRALVTLRPASRLKFVAAVDDRDEYDSLKAFEMAMGQGGFYGGVRLLKAALKRILEFCQDRYELNAGNFEITWSTNIPRGVGMAGSSAIVTAALKALSRHFRVPLEPPVLASLALSAERDLLGIPAGLQDRVVQSLQGVVFMDFATRVSTEVDGMQVGRYESLSVTPGKPIPLYVAFSPAAAEPTEVFHNRLGQRFRDGEAAVVDAMAELADLAQAGRDAWIAGDASRFHELVDRNFDIRRSICRLPAAQVEMIETARMVGASAKFCGSGGAIVGTVPNPEAYPELEHALKAIGCTVISPEII